MSGGESKGFGEKDFTSVSALAPGSGGHRMLLKVAKVTVTTETMCAGVPLRVAEALVGDSSGCIHLLATNEQIGQVQPGSTIVLEEARVRMLKGFMSLEVAEGGSISRAAKLASFDVAEANNLSKVEYELVHLQ